LQPSCSSSANFGDTAELIGFHILDADGNIIDNSVTLQTASGFDYRSVNTPEPAATGLLLFGFAILLLRVLGSNRAENRCKDESYATSSRASAGFRSGRSSPRMTDSGTEKAYLESIRNRGVRQEACSGKLPVWPSFNPIVLTTAR
jgi:hypothetical protein